MSKHMLKLPYWLKQGEMPKELPYIIVDPDCKSISVQLKTASFQFEALNQI